MVQYGEIGPGDLLLGSKTNLSFQFITSYVWYSKENLAGDILSGLKLLTYQFSQHSSYTLFSTARLGELRSQYLVKQVINPIFHTIALMLLGFIWTKNKFTNEWWEVESAFRVSGRGRIGADGLVGTCIVVRHKSCSTQCLPFTVSLPCFSVQKFAKT